VQSPAKQPPPGPGAPVPDRTPKYTGTGNFTTTNMEYRGSKHAPEKTRESPRDYAVTLASLQNEWRLNRSYSTPGFEAFPLPNPIIPIIRFPFNLMYLGQTIFLTKVWLLLGSLSLFFVLISDHWHVHRLRATKFE